MDKTTATVLGVVALVLVAGFVVLSLNGRDTSSYAIFLGGPLVTGLLGSLLVRKTAQVQSDVSEVKSATNGLLANRFAEVSDRFDDASQERQDIAAAAGDVQDAHVAGRTQPYNPRRFQAP